MKLHTKKVTGLAAVTLAFALAVSGCGKGAGDSSSDSGSSDSKTTSVTFIPKNLGNPYFDISDAGGQAAVKEFGGKYSQVGPAGGEPRRAGAVHRHRGAEAHLGDRDLRQRPGRPW